MKDANFCPIHAALDKIGGKWKLLILWHLCQGPQQFNQLKRSVGGISTKVLSDQLRELQEDGLISRTPLDTRPPQVIYAVTDAGKNLNPVMEHLYTWSLDSFGQPAASFDAPAQSLVS